MAQNPVTFERNAEGYWVATIAALPNCSAMGWSRKEAMVAVRELEAKILAGQQPA